HVRAPGPAEADPVGGPGGPLGAAHGHGRADLCVGRRDAGRRRGARGGRARGVSLPCRHRGARAGGRGGPRHRQGDGRPGLGHRGRVREAEAHLDPDRAHGRAHRRGARRPARRADGGGAMSAERFIVLVTDKVSGAGLEPFEQDDRFDIVKVDDSKDPAFEQALATAHGLVVRSATKVRADMLDKAPKLRVVGRAGVGVDNIDLEAATARGVAVLNAPAGNTVSAAELTMALIMSMVRQVAAADASMRRGEWARSKFQGVELRGRTLGLIGAGRIGGTVAKRCKAFRMRVMAYDPYLTDEAAADLGVERAELADVIASADVLSLHVPLTDATANLIDAAALASMKKGAFLVNVARGGVVDEAALAKALTDGHLAGAALDVYGNEPLEEDSPLRTAPNLVLTPHLGASTAEAQELVATEIAEAVRD